MAKQDLRGDVEAGAVPAPEDELRPVTSLFADVVGSTGLGERLMPAEVKAVIGECVSRMCEVVEAYGGHVRSYMGDGIAAFFGIEATREDDPERASRAALEILRTIAGYASEVRSAWGVADLNVRVGVNCGRVAVGQVGAGEPLTVALGDSVNVAARLQSAASPGTILVGGSVASAVTDRFAMRPLGKVAIKGRESAVDAFELVGEQPAPLKSFNARFAGRENELGLLTGMFSDLLAGRGQVCLVVGEGGLGKTRLLGEVRHRAPSDVVWLEGYCDPMDQRLPYEPFVEALRGWLGLDRRSSSIETRVRLKARGSDLLGDQFDDCAPYLARLLGVELGARLDRSLEGLPGDVLTSGLIKSYVTWLTALATRSAVVLALDNFGSVNEAGSQLALAVLEALESDPILLLLSLRPEGRTPGWEVRARALADVANRATEIRLSPLRTDECRVIVDSLDAQDVLDERLKHVVIERAEGNPLFLEELYSAVTSDDSTEEVVAQHLPRALESLLLSKIDALPADAKSTLQAAAVLGRFFMKDVVARMHPDCDVSGSFATLLRADVIRERSRDPAGFVFRHGLVREAALSTLTPVRYRALNRSAAIAIEEWESFDLERDGETLAGHYLACGDLAQAVECLEHLGDRLAAQCRFEEATGVYQRCLREFEGVTEDCPYVRIARKVSKLWAMRGDGGEALRVLDEAIARAAPSEHVDILIAKARQLADAGLIHEAEAVLDSTKAAGPIEDPTASLILRGQLALARQDLELAGDCVAQVGELTALGPELGFEAASLHAGVLATTGDLDGAEMLALQAQAFADQVGRTTDQLTARRHVALVCLLRGCAREAYELTRFVYNRYEQLGFVAGQLESGVNLLHVGHLVGELEECSRVASVLSRLTPGPLWRALIAANWAVAEFERNNLNQALELAETTLDLCREVESWPAVTAHMVNATIALARHDWKVAMREISSGEEIALRAGRDVEKALLKSTLASVIAQSGDAHAAVSCAYEAFTTSVPLDVVTRAQMQRTYGELLADIDREGGIRVLQQNLAANRQMGLRLEEGRALVALGSLDCDDAEQHFAQAEQIFTECGCLRGLVELEEARRSVRPNAPTVS